MPRVKLKRRSEVGCRGQVKTEAGEIDCSVGHQEQDGAQLSDLVQGADEETHACRNGLKYFLSANVMMFDLQKNNFLTGI